MSAAMLLQRETPIGAVPDKRGVKRIGCAKDLKAALFSPESEDSNFPVPKAVQATRSSFHRCW
jgi:hypothetical protein